MKWSKRAPHELSQIDLDENERSMMDFSTHNISHVLAAANPIPPDNTASTDIAKAPVASAHVNIGNASASVNNTAPVATAAILSPLPLVSNDNTSLVP